LDLTKQKGIEISGSIYAENGEIDHDEFTDKFIDFIESNGWYFGGGTKQVDEEGIMINEPAVYNGKYKKLFNYLKALDHNISDIKLSFQQIENILEVKLPKSAKDYPAWWANQGYGTQAKSWLYAGWKTVNVKPGVSIEFIR
jgi:hypothetical protein